MKIHEFQGKRVFVLRQGSAFSTILGIAHLVEDRVLVWPELFKEG